MPAIQAPNVTVGPYHGYVPRGHEVDEVHVTICGGSSIDDVNSAAEQLRQHELWQLPDFEAGSVRAVRHRRIEVRSVYGRLIIAFQVIRKVGVPLWEPEPKQSCGAST